ncbi:hypothetical protein [Dyadobacter sp. CY347]|uniref:hypothetical protein n=1 Tax=Dyadobacter sp. CY347 TaxID=2909336 RepID=UPI001F1CF8F3|nr:hypothetical protein [Dyadobacter sp. CY347]MCF2490774.1 hypothetical protein [Dyadobacter sp. CY347]
MNLNKIVRFTLAPFLMVFLNIQCKDPDKQAGPCNCDTKTRRKEIKNAEAVVVLIKGNNPPYGNTGPDAYILSTAPRDFEDSSYIGGENILVPCGSLPAQYQKQGTKLIVSYKRKDCYGAMTTPTRRTNFGYFVNLTSIRMKP